jgi:hypothetical protein
MGFRRREGVSPGFVRVSKSAIMHRDGQRIRQPCLHSLHGQFFPQARFILLLAGGSGQGFGQTVRVPVRLVLTVSAVYPIVLSQIEGGR